MTAARVVLQKARLQLFQSGSTSSIDIKAWVANQNYFFTKNIEATTFSLRASDPDQLRQALANDLNRLASAAFESAAGIGPDLYLPRSLAWGAVRSYYAAFFAAHAFIRLFGSACVQLDDEHVDKVFGAASAFGRDGGLKTLDSGFFVAEIEPDFSAVTFRRLRDSHRDTWATLISVVNAVEAGLPGTTALGHDKLEAATLLSNLKAQLTRSGSAKGSWLSSMRNAINYRQSHGAWHPYQRSADPSLLDSAARAWRVRPSLGTPGTSQSELEIFLHTSTSLVALVRELMVLAAQLNSPLSPTFSNGCMKLLSEATTPRRPSAG